MRKWIHHIKLVLRILMNPKEAKLYDTWVLYQNMDKYAKDIMKKSLKGSELSPEDTITMSKYFEAEKAYKEAFAALYGESEPPIPPA